MTEHRLGVCPDCGTELTPVRGRRGSRYVWCWKCERALRPGEARRARLDSVGAGWRRCMHCNGSDGNCEECAGAGVVLVQP
jgi:hypothetical protein